MTSAILDRIANGRTDLVFDHGRPPDKARQADKVNRSCLLHSQKPRQLAFAAELGR